MTLDSAPSSAATIQSDPITTLPNSKEAMAPSNQSVEQAAEHDLEKQPRSSTESSVDSKIPETKTAYPPAREVILVMISLYLVMFLMALVSHPLRVPLRI